MKRKRSDVQIGDVERILPVEFAPRLDHAAHQTGGEVVVTFNVLQAHDCGLESYLILGDTIAEIQSHMRGAVREENRGNIPVMEFIQKLKFPTLLLLTGGFLIAASAYDQINFKELVLHPRPSTAVFPLVVGIGLLLLATLIFLLEEGFLPAFGSSAVRRTGAGFAGHIGRSRILIHFGRLEEKVIAEPSGEAPLVLLPTNEFFDDDCFKATGTACGAYLRAKAPNHLDRLKEEIGSAVANLVPLGEFEKEHGKVETSYGAGSCVFIEHPLGLAHSLLLAAVASKRSASGFQSNQAHIFNCIERMAVITTDHRISSVYMPLLGAGKGGLTPAASLMAILLSISTMQRRLGGFDAAINIVVFQPVKTAKPSIEKRSVRAILGLAIAMHNDRKDAH